MENTPLKKYIGIIKSSSFFDREWYLNNFPDVGISGIDAAEHYFRIGWRIGRDPGPNFNTKDFLSKKPYLAKSEICPLIFLEENENIIGNKNQNNNKIEKGNGADSLIIENSPLFDSEWYFSNYKDFSGEKLSASDHYLSYGAKFLWNPGPNFSTRFYLQEHRDVRNVGMNPLLHYEKFGRREGRAILPAYLDSVETDPAISASARPERQGKWADRESARRYLSRQLGAIMLGEPVRMFRTFDVAQAERFITALDICANEEVEEELVSVVMPTYNRGAKIAAAIDSVLQQSWKNFELLIVDDGSTDNTPEILSSYEDERIRILHSAHGGVSVARNEGLRHARGEVIFYLDSDNQWTKDFLWVMMQSMRHSGAACGYAGTRLQAPNGYLIGYRGEPFNWESCLALNYVDMNVFCHRKEMVERFGGFDAGLRRMVDWDLILRYTRDENVFYAPFIGCIYIEDSGDMGRITTSQPIVSRKLVHTKNALNCSLSEAVSQLRFNIAIKIFAPYQDRDAWGDFHYAESLAEALEKIGHRVRIDFRGHWYDNPASSDDISIVLRGLEAYKPRSTQISLLWGISHPDTVSPEEYDGYHGIFIASRSYAEMLEVLLGRSVETMWQCTDAGRFFPPYASAFTEEDSSSAQQGIFIGNSRREYRQIVRWAVETGMPLDVIGQDWEGYLPAGMIKAKNAPNRELSNLYGSASFVLNDHWASMRDFGYVSNRVFDVLASGGQLISDRVPSIEALFGDAVISVSSAEELRSMIENGAMKRDRAEKLKLSDAVRQDHSFTHRAEAFDRWIRNYLMPDATLGKDGVPPVLADRWKDRVRVGLLASWSEPAMLDMAIERLVAPLTSDEAATQLRLMRVETADDVLNANLEVLLIAGNSCEWSAPLQAAIATRLEQGLPVFLDKVPPVLGEDIGRLLPNLAGIWGDEEVAAKRLDPRIWRLYRSPRPIEPLQGVTRLLAVYGFGEGKDSYCSDGRIRELLGLDLQENKLSFQIVGMDRQEFQSQPWLSFESWPEGCANYMRRARWLLEHASADIGIIFGEAENSDSQVLYMMALGIVPVVIAPASKSLARSEALEDLVTICESVADLPDALERLTEHPHRLLEKRRVCIKRLWQDYNVLTSLDPRVSSILAAAYSFRSKVSA